MWEYRRRVRYYETDRMGVVHHSNYLRFLENARMDWLKDNVTSYSEIEKMGIIVPAVDATCEFKSFLRYDDPYVIQVQPSKFTGVRVAFRYKIFNENTKELCFQGSTSHYFAADGDYHPISLKRKYPDMYKAFLKAVKGK